MKVKVYKVPVISMTLHIHVAEILKTHKIKSIIDMGGVGNFKELLDCPVQDANIKKGIDGTKLPYANNTFDASVSIATLEHVDNQLKFLQESSRVAKTMAIHWFPFGSDAEDIERFKLSLGHPHYCKLPTDDIIKIARTYFKSVEFYPMCCATEHLLLLATHRPKLNHYILHKYINSNRKLNKTWGWVFLGKI